MANCKSYQALAPKEQIELIGQLVHIVQTDEWFFYKAKQLIEEATEAGSFDKVKVGFAVFDNFIPY